MPPDRLGSRSGPVLRKGGPGRSGAGRSQLIRGWGWCGARSRPVRLLELEDLGRGGWAGRAYRSAAGPVRPGPAPGPATSAPVAGGRRASDRIGGSDRRLNAGWFAGRARSNRTTPTKTVGRVSRAGPSLGQVVRQVDWQVTRLLARLLVRLLLEARRRLVGSPGGGLETCCLLLAIICRSGRFFLDPAPAYAIVRLRG